MHAITPEAEAVTGLSLRDGVLCYRGDPVRTVTLHQALTDFLDFITKFEKPLLVGHNIRNFDLRVLLHHLKACNMASSFAQSISGCVDTLNVAKAVLPKRKSYKQEVLVQDLLGEQYDSHNAVDDVRILQELCVRKFQKQVHDHVFPVNVVTLAMSLDPLVKQKCISAAIRSKIANSGLGYSHLKLAHQRNADLGLKSLLSEKTKGKVRVTSNAKVIARVNEYFAKL